MYRISLWGIVLALAGVAAAQSTSGLGEGILQETSLAQRALADHNQATALDHVRQALANAGAIQRQMPSTSPILVPVSREVDTTTTYRPVKPSNKEDLRLKHDSSVRDVEGVTTISSLNVTAAAIQLEAAQTALQRGDWTAAGVALDAVSKSVVQSQSTADMPLAMASQNLQLARQRVQDGKYRDAAVPLRAAADALANYQRMHPGPQADAVETVREQIANCADRIAHRHDDVLVSIDAWSGSIDQWRKAEAQ